MIKSKNLQKEIIYFTEEINKNPNDPRLYFLRGTCYHGQANFKLAIDDYTKAYDLNPNNNSFPYKTGDNTFDNSIILRNRISAKKSYGDKKG